MAKCKLCKTNIPDGAEYCEACLDKSSSKTNESYLDSLLNSVINTEASAGTAYKKRENTESKLKKKESDSIPYNKSKEEERNMESGFNVGNQAKKELENMESYEIDFNDIKDFENFDIDNDIEDNIFISDEDLFGKDIKDIFSEEVPEKEIFTSQLNNRDNSLNLQPEAFHEEKPDYNTKESLENEENFAMDKQVDFLNKENNDYDDLSDLLKQESVRLEETAGKAESEISAFDKEQKPAAATLEPFQENTELKETVIHNNISQNEIDHFMEEDEEDTTLRDLMSSLDLSVDESNGQADSEEVRQSLHEGLEHVNFDEVEDLDEDGVDPEEAAADDDILSLLNQINPGDPVADDLQAINELLSGSSGQNKVDRNVPSDVGEVFSDALKVVSSLEDPDIDELTSLEHLTSKKDKKKDKKKEKELRQLKKLEKKQKKKNKQDKIETISEEKPKKGFIQRFFGNVEDESSNKKANGQLSYQDETALASDTSKKTKKRKGKNKPADPQNQSENFEEEATGKKKLASKAEIKKEKKEKKKKNKEIMQVIDEIDEDEGRINRVGATIVFLFFGTLVLLLLVGTNIFSYSISINNATRYFDRHKYTEAYNEVYGVEIKDQDIEIYDKIMTVMYVNKQLNSYNSFYAIKQYPQALDSLLKGLSRYDKYIELATMLGINTDLDYVRNQILSELDNVFNISEEEAMQILRMESQAEYSVKVYDIVLEKMNY